MGEFKVHRVRFFDYMPTAIRAMAFNAHTERLALARMDGSVEIFNFTDHYFQEKVIPGKDSRSTESLCWVGGRLFSAGLNGEITEYDLENLRPKYSLEAYGGPIWTIISNTQGTQLAIGCEDGTVKLFEVLEEHIQFERNLDRQKGRIISLSWHPSGTHIAAGMMDMILVSTLMSMLLVDRGFGGSKSQETVVWSVAFLSDHTVVSGDSAGKVQVWDGHTGTLVKTHLVTKWDVLALSVSKDESSVVAGTSEGTVIQFQFIAPTLHQQQDKEWVRTRTFKNHTHDVRALAEIETAIVSGGMDTHLVVRPLLEKFDEKSHASGLRKIHFPHRNLVSCAKKAGLLLFQFPGQLELWRLGDSDGHGKPGDRLPLKRKPEKLLLLKRKGEDHICCSALSSCGGWLAYSTVSCVRIYRLQTDNNNISITKVSKLPKALRSAHQLCFSSDSSKMFAASSQSSVLVIALTQSECKYVHTLKPKSGSRQPIHLMTTSVDGKWLAAANSDSAHGPVLVFQLHCIVPVYGSCPSAMGIHPTTNNMTVVHADQQLFEYSIVEKQYTDWSRKLQKQGLHNVWLDRDTPVTHVTFNPKNPNQVVLHDMHMFCIIDQSLPLPDQKTQFYNQMTLRSLSEQERPSHLHAFKICKTFQDLLCVSLLDDQSLVVVERPLLAITSQLPAPVRQKKFAT
uniref:UTP4 small subunit processome component n=1 Tax=Oncorhynchus mykiss TaxID=8022 RepID=A0A8C7Q326_ONCMY